MVSTDADALLKDACAVLRTGQESLLLRTIDTGTVVAIMSDQAFREIGWMSAPAARGHHVSNADLRAMLAAEYLPRVPVVTTPVSKGDHWMPNVDDVTDPKDVAHVEVARLVLGTAVFSHDRDLRIPGHAPRTRELYDERLERLGLVARYRVAEHGAGLVLTAVGVGTKHVVGHAAAKLRVGRPAAWSVVAAVAAATLYWVGAKSSRRAKVGESFGPAMTKLVEAQARAASVEEVLRNSPLLAPSDTDRLEVRVAAHLVRYPDSSASAIAGALGLKEQEEQRELSVLLREHPAFERVGRWGWAVGRIRNALETEPSKDWRPS
ncbi:hypothetical protein [Phycicoccus sp. Soil748]|uniref:hypothetical protein n=1 Tax=Phycicoccus sp. Soil748 TaxID=1736397 RepID=UPI000AA25D57|nr:hypothetical protein [Phycicoccus sp. Soil748]